MATLSDILDWADKQTGDIEPKSPGIPPKAVAPETPAARPVTKWNHGSYSSEARVPATEVVPAEQASMKDLYRWADLIDAPPQKSVSRWDAPSMPGPYYGRMKTETMDDVQVDTLQEAIIRNAAGGDPFAEKERQIRHVVTRIPTAPAELEWSLKVGESFKRHKAGEATDEDLSILAEFVNEAWRQDQKSWTQYTVEMMSMLPKYMVEFSVGAGVYHAGKGAVKELGYDVAKRGAANTVVKEFVRDGLKTKAGKAGAWLAKQELDAAGSVVGAAGQALANPDLAIKAIVQRLGPEVGLSVDDAGQLEFILKQSDESFATSVGKGTLDGVIEVLSERLGGKIAKSVLVKKVKGAIVGRFLAKSGNNVAKMQATLLKAGWNGVLEESFEERAGEVARGVTGVADDFGVTGELATNPLSKEAWSQIASEVVAFSPPMVVTGGARFADARKRKADLKRLKEVLHPQLQQSRENRQMPEAELADKFKATIERIEEDGTPSRAEARFLNFPFEQQKTKKQRKAYYAQRRDEYTQLLQPQETTPPEQEQTPAPTEPTSPVAEAPPQEAATTPAQPQQVETPAPAPQETQAPAKTTAPAPKPKTPVRRFDIIQRLKSRDRGGRIYLSHLREEHLGHLSREQQDELLREWEKAEAVAFYPLENPREKTEAYTAAGLANSAGSNREFLIVDAHTLGNFEAAEEVTPQQTAVQPKLAQPKKTLKGKGPTGRRNIRTYAEKQGLSPDALLSAAEDVHRGMKEDHNNRRDTKRYAHKLTGLSIPNIVQVENAGFDFASGKKVGGKTGDKLDYFDEYAQEIVASHPEVFGTVEDASRAVWDLLREPAAKELRLDDPKVLAEAETMLGDGKKTAPSKKKAKAASKLKKQKVQANKELKEAFDEFGDALRKAGIGMNPFANPELVTAAARLTSKAVKAGVLNFADMMADVTSRFGQTTADTLEPMLKAQWFAMRRAKELPETSIKNEYTDLLSEQLNVAPAEKPSGQSREEWKEQAREEIRKDADAASKLLRELIWDPRPLTAAETTLLQVYLRQRGNEYKDAYEHLLETYATGDAAEIAHAQLNMDVIIGSIETIMEATAGIKAEWSRAGTALQSVLLEDYSFAEMERRARIAKGGEKLTDKESAKIKEQADRIAELEAQLEKRKEKDADGVIDDLIEDATPGKKRKGLKGKRGKKEPVDPAEMDVDPDDNGAIGRAAQDLLRYFVEQGHTDRDVITGLVNEALKEMGIELTLRETMDAISGYGQWKPLDMDETKAAMRDIKGQLQQVGKLDDMAAGKAPQKTGQERRDPSFEERNLIKLVNEAKKRGGFEDGDPAKRLKSALESAKTAIRNRIKDMTAEIEAEERLIKKRMSLKPDPGLEALRKQRDLLKQKWDKLFTNTEQARIEATEKALDRAISLLQAEIASGDVMPKPLRKKVTSPEISAKQATLEHLKSVREAMRKVEDPRWEFRHYETILRRRKVEYLRRIEEGDFAPKKRPERKMDPKLLKDLGEVEQIKAKFQDMRDAWTRANRTRVQKLRGLPADLFRTSHELLTSYDVSAPGRQGIFFILSHPIKASWALKPMIGSLISEESYFRSLAQLKQRGNSHLYIRDKLALTTYEGKLTKQEESVRGHWGKMFPGVKQSQRAYVAFLTTLRANMYDHLTATLGRKGGITAAEGRIIADFVNVATGRGGLWKLEAASGVLADYFFSPRFVSSRIQMAMGSHLWLKGNRRTKLLVLKEHARAMASATAFVASVMFLFGLGEDDEDKPTLELSPLSTNFGRISYKNSHIDLSGGILPAMMIVAKATRGIEKKADGTYIDLRGDKKKWGQGVQEEIVQWSRYKLSPLGSFGVNILTGETAMHEEITPLSQAKDLTVPLVWREYHEIAEEHNLPKGTALSLMATAGTSISTYDPNKSKKNKAWYEK